MATLRMIFFKFYMLFSSYFSMLIDLAKHFEEQKGQNQRSPSLHNNGGCIDFLKLKSKSMISNVTFFATLHYLFHSYYIMHAFQELVLLP